MALCSSVQSPGEVTGWWVVLELVTQACLHGGVNCSLLSRAGVFSSDHCSSSSISYTKAEKHLWACFCLFFFFFSLLTVGPLIVSFRALPSERTIIKKNPFVQSGGLYRPPHCLARYKSAILVAYSNQEKDLHHFLYYIHPFLQRQQLSYRIYLIQQVSLNQIPLLGGLSLPVKHQVLSKKCESCNMEAPFYAWVKQVSYMPSYLHGCCWLKYLTTCQDHCSAIDLLCFFFCSRGIKLSLSGNLYFPQFKSWMWAVCQWLASIATE